VTPDNLRQRRGALFTMLTALDFRYVPGPEPALLAALRQWFSGWPGIGRIVAGLNRQGLDLQLTRYGTDGWRATVFPAGIAHSMTSAVGTAMAPEPWVAVQQAAREGLR
jgi:hypothetical protein